MAELSDKQKAVLHDKATEPPFSGRFLKIDKSGVFICADCGSELFHSDTKFKAPYPNEGWPSFYDVVKEGNVELKEDTSHGMTRTEAVCANCGGHLGHVFYDGDPQKNKGTHYCINSAALNLRTEDGEVIRGDE